MEMALYKLLIVDDETEVRSGLCNYFPWQEVGFEVVGQCANGKDAENFLDCHTVDVLLCDIRMPVMDGIELARRLRSRNNHVVIIFISAYKSFEYAHAAIDYGIKKYLVRPTRYSEIMSVFTDLKNELDLQRGIVLDENAAETDQIVAAVQRYVLKNYQDASLEKAAQKVFLSPYYLSKIFKERSGQLFSDFLVEVRMKRAANLLLSDQSLKIYQISEQVGYRNAKNFTRRFVSYFHMSPREYRNQKRKE